MKVLGPNPSRPTNIILEIPFPMGDKKRFDLFVKAISKRFPSWMRVADIAGGKGYLQLALKEQGFKDVITFDCKPRKNRVRVHGVKFCWRKFDHNIETEFDLLVGMHPDEATDVIIYEAAKRRIPFGIVPCCIMPTRLLFWDKRNYRGWVKALTKMAETQNFEVEKYQLRMNGKNLALFGKPK